MKFQKWFWNLPGIIRNPAFLVVVFVVLVVLMLGYLFLTRRQYDRLANWIDHHTGIFV